MGGLLRAGDVSEVAKLTWLQCLGRVRQAAHAASVVLELRRAGVRCGQKIW